MANCGKSNSAPDDLIPQDKMIPILIEIHIAEAMIQLKELTDDSIAMYSKAYYDRIFEDHQVSQTQFENSMDYYVDHPELYESIYTKVQEEVKQIRQGIE